MRIFNESGLEINTQIIEFEEQRLAKEFIRENDVVLELGARYGSVSCVINNILSNKKSQVSVEPDHRVWVALKDNREKNGAEFNIIEGFISRKKLNLVPRGYDTTFSHDETSDCFCCTLDEVEEKFNLNFNVLVADCEGFLEIFLDENPKLYEKMRAVIFEADMTDICNYDKIRKNLFFYGFIEKVNGHQNVWVKE
jgi:FkbM family methyltransferase